MTLAQQSFEAVELDGFPLLRGHLAHVYFLGEGPLPGDWLAIRAEMPITLLGKAAQLPVWATFAVAHFLPGFTGQKRAMFVRLEFDRPVGIAELVEQDDAGAFLAAILPKEIGTQRVFVVSETEEPEESEESAEATL